MRLPRLKTTLCGALAALLALTWLGAGRALAEPPSFLAEVDRNVVSPGDVFVYEVTVNTSGERLENYHPPDFKGLSVVNAPRGPNQSTQMSMGGGGTFIQTSYSWHYELAAAPGQKGV